MTKGEVIEVVNDLLQENDPVTVAAALTKMYLDDKLTIDDLEFCVCLCGFELVDSFKNATKEEQRIIVMEVEQQGQAQLNKKKKAKPKWLLKKDPNVKAISQQELRELVLKQLEEHSPEKVANHYVKMYIEHNIDLEGTKFAVGLCGFELTDDFLNSSFEEQKQKVEDFDNRKDH